MSHRIRFFVVNHDGGWAIRRTVDGFHDAEPEAHDLAGLRQATDIHSEYGTKEDAVAAATKMARTNQAEGHDSQVLIQDRHGRWADERTYGHDPRSIPG